MCFCKLNFCNHSIFCWYIQLHVEWMKNSQKDGYWVGKYARRRKFMNCIVSYSHRYISLIHSNSLSLFLSFSLYFSLFLALSLALSRSCSLASSLFITCCLSSSCCSCASSRSMLVFVLTNRCFALFSAGWLQIRWDGWNVCKLRKSPEVTVRSSGGVVLLHIEWWAVIPPYAIYAEVCFNCFTLA